MKILFIGYWNLSDPLTVSTIFPHLRILNGFSWITKIIFINIEREQSAKLPANIDLDKVEYRPFSADRSKGFLYEKVSDFVEGPKFISRVAKGNKVDFIIARGAPAGSLAYLVWRKTRIPFLVESFEPHADYMVESGVWSRYDPRFLLQKVLEYLQRKSAAGFMPVTNNYKSALIRNGLDSSKLVTVPCCVDPFQFGFSNEMRLKIRQQLNIPEEAIVGVYAGRFGGLYMESDALLLYRTAFEFFQEKLYLILLTPTIYHPWLLKGMKQFSLPETRVFIRSVPHDLVPHYFSAGDFGLATYKSGASKAFLSPVKVAEYWANGLPILLTNGVGDENDILLKFPFAGVLFDPSRIEELGYCYFQELEGRIKNRSGSVSEITKLVSRFRNFDRVVEAYTSFLYRP